MSATTNQYGPEPTKFDVGGNRQLSVAEIAEETGLSKAAIEKRIKTGKVGSSLLEPAKSPEAKWGWVDKRWAEAEAQPGGLTDQQKQWRDELMNGRRRLPSGNYAVEGK